MLRTLLYRIGGILLIAGAVMPVIAPLWAPYVFAVGALLFSFIQLTDPYEGSTLTLRRLRRQQMIGALMLLITAALMLTAHYGVPPFRGREWMITLLIATLLEVYTTFRIDQEEKRHEP